jgi:hypothetical protein
MRKARFWFLFVFLTAGDAFSAQAPQEFDAKALQAEPGKAAKRYVKEEAGKRIRGIKKIFIPSFKVEFVTLRDAWMPPPEGGSPANLRVALSGVDRDVFQALTEKIYADFLARLAGPGLEPFATAELESNLTYRDLQTWSSSGPVRTKFSDEEDNTTGESLVFSPSAVPLYFTSDEPGGSGLGAAKRGSPDELEPLLVYQLGAALMKVSLKVDFLQFAPTRKIFKRGKAISVPYYPVVRVTGHVSVWAPGTLSVVQKPFNKGVKVSFSGARPDFRLVRPVTAMDYFVTTADAPEETGSLRDGHRNIDINANPAVYQDAVVKAAGFARDLLLFKMEEDF